MPGSHRRGDLQRQAGRLERHPDEIAREGPAGTAFVLSGHVLHAGGLNRSSGPRPALQLVWRR
ncbi:MAG: phytanoyl-CoA dioxygenase family protein [Acidimicrobiales bacterium]